MRSSQAASPVGGEGCRASGEFVRGSPSLSAGDVELLDAVVVGIHHVQLAAAIDRHAMRGEELAWFTPLLVADAAQELPLARELLDPAAGGADPNAILLVDAEADRPLEPGLEPRELAA